MKSIEVLAVDLDGSVMPQGGPMLPSTAELFRFLHGIGLIIGPATGKNEDYCRGGDVFSGGYFDFYTTETGACFSRLIQRSPPVFEHYEPAVASDDLRIFGQLIRLDMFGAEFSLADGTREKFRLELKKKILTLFPPGKDLTVSEKWKTYFEDIVMQNGLKLKILRHSDGCIDIVPEAISKKLAIDMICQVYDVTPKNILVVVDGVNDLELCEGTVVLAVGNAVPMIKEAAEKFGGYIAKGEHAFGFAEGLLHFAQAGRFEKHVNDAILRYFGKL